MPYKDPEKRKEYHRSYIARWRAGNKEKEKEYIDRRHEKNREAQKEYHRQYYLNNKEKFKDRSKDWYDKNKEEWKSHSNKWYHENKGSALLRRKKRLRDEVFPWWNEYRDKLECSRCKESDINCIDFHHRDPKEKERSPISMVSGLYPKEKILAEIAKCDILCANCHRKEHARLKNGA